MANPNDVFVRCEDVLYSSFDDAVVMLNLDGDRYLGGNESAKEIWVRLNGVRSIEEICSELSELYNGSLAEILSDVAVFVDRLERAGVVRRVR